MVGFTHDYYYHVVVDVVVLVHGDGDGGVYDDDEVVANK